MSRAKRQFAGDAAQRSITSYFNPVSTTATTTTAAAAASPSDGADFRPQLPPSVQANLINVGMRVRKSVPEGYKTGKEVSGIGLFTNNAKAAASGGGGGFVARAAAPATRAAAAAAAVPSRPSELMPFCGIHKTGGLDSAVPALDAVPGLSYSQESTVAIDEDSWGGRAIATSRKRLNDDDELELEDEDEAEGNRILVPPHAVNGTEYLAAGRTIAIPRRRKTVTAADDDFEEAQFLDIAGMR